MLSVGFALLSTPLPVLRSILAFADAEYHDDVVPTAPQQVPQQLCVALRSSSRVWCYLLDMLTAQYQRECLTFSFANKSAEEIAQLTAALDLRGDALRCLTLRESDRAPLRLDGVNWRITRLQRLDLSALGSDHVLPVLNVAASAFPTLQALVLSTSISNGDLDSVLGALSAALRNWYETNRYGLRQLTVACSPAFIAPNAQRQSPTRSDRFLTMVATHCPNIEYLDGTDVSYEEHEGYATTREIWYGSKSAWETFCRRCTKLRALHWMAVPLVDDFVRVFAQFPKPNLTTLTLAAVVEDVMKDRTVDDVTGAYYTDGEWTNYTRQGIALLPSGCPALETLQIHLSCDFRWDPLQIVISDDLLIAVARDCRRLRRLCLKRIYCWDCQEGRHSGFADTWPPVLERVTARGVQAIASLPLLQHIELFPTKRGAAGVYALMQMAPQCGPPRVAHVQTDASLVDVVGRLEYLVRAGRGELLGRRFNVVLSYDGYIEDATDERELANDLQMLSDCPHYPLLEAKRLQDEFIPTVQICMLP